MKLARMMTDKVFFEDKNGTRSGPYKTKFGADRITVFQDELPVAEGDRVIQPLPDGTEQVYIAEVVSYNTGRGNIPGHFSIAIARVAASPIPVTSATNAGIASAPDAQAGKNNTEHIAVSLRCLAECIEGAPFPAEQKDEARHLLRTLAAHPVVAAILGAVKAE